jgi:hypothetical protein
MSGEDQKSGPARRESYWLGCGPGGPALARRSIFRARRAVVGAFTTLLRHFDVRCSLGSLGTPPPTSWAAGPAAPTALGLRRVQKPSASSVALRRCTLLRVRPDRFGTASLLFFAAVRYCSSVGAATLSTSQLLDEQTCEFTPRGAMHGNMTPFLPVGYRCLYHPFVLGLATQTLPEEAHRRYAEDHRALKRLCANGYARCDPSITSAAGMHFA